jgi:hypothetical protein
VVHHVGEVDRGRQAGDGDHLATLGVPSRATANEAPVPVWTDERADALFVCEGGRKTATPGAQ